MHDKHPGRVGPDDGRDEDELGDDEVAAYASQLKALQVELRAQLASAQESAQTVDLDAPIGRLTRMDALQRQQMAAAALRRQRQRLGHVADALARIRETDLYGLCLRCEEPIGRRRLDARPEAPICMACQRAEERRGA